MGLIFQQSLDNNQYFKTLKKANNVLGNHKFDLTKSNIKNTSKSLNDKGKVIFIKIQDAEGILQCYVKRDDICPTEDKTFFDEVVKRLDLGDIIGAKGHMFITKTGETSLHTAQVTLLSKSLKPLPVVKRDEEGNAFDEVTDPEFRYRQRYADLVVNPHVKEVFVKRTKIMNCIGATLGDKNKAIIPANSQINMICWVLCW